MSLSLSLSLSLFLLVVVGVNGAVVPSLPSKLPGNGADFVVYVSTAQALGRGDRGIDHISGC